MPDRVFELFCLGDHLVDSVSQFHRLNGERRDLLLSNIEHDVAVQLVTAQPLHIFESMAEVVRSKVPVHGFKMLKNPI